MRTLMILMLSVTLATIAFSDISLYWTDLAIPDPTPHPVGEGGEVLLSADMGTAFSRIDSARLIFTFQDDLWDLGETIAVYFPTGSVGMSSTAHEPIHDPNSWTLDLWWGPPTAALLDGQADFAFNSISGSVSIQSCRLEVWAEAVPEPSSLVLVTLGFIALGARQRRTRGWSLRFARGGQNETHP